MFEDTKPISLISYPNLIRFCKLALNETNLCHSEQLVRTRFGKFFIGSVAFYKNYERRSVYLKFGKVEGMVVPYKQSSTKIKFHIPFTTLWFFLPNTFNLYTLSEFVLLSTPSPFPCISEWNLPIRLKLSLQIRNSRFSQSPPPLFPYNLLTPSLGGGCPCYDSGIFCRT